MYLYIICRLCCANLLQLCLTFCDSMDCSPLDSSVHEFSRQEYCSGLIVPYPGDLLDLGIKPQSLRSSALAGGYFTSSATWEAHIMYICILKLALYIYIIYKYVGKCLFWNSYIKVCLFKVCLYKVFWNSYIKVCLFWNSLILFHL